MDDIPGSQIHSCQNGFLLNARIHWAFDQYLISVNPDDGYKIVAFGTDDFGVYGRVLDPVSRNPNDPHRVSPHLLQWRHFRQSVLANMRGAGEPLFCDDDLPREPDMGDGIIADPQLVAGISQVGGGGTVTLMG